MDKKIEDFCKANNYTVYDHKTRPSEKKNIITLFEKQSSQVKLAPSLEKAIENSELKNGMTISFHHHFRGGDYIVNQVMAVLDKMGFKDLNVVSSSLSAVHKPLTGYIKNGLIKRIETSGLRGELAEEISEGIMDEPVIFRSHGGRAAAITDGEIHINVAFLGASSCDLMGNANGYTREGVGKTMCGSLGYARIDAQYADHVIIITDNLVPYPNVPFGISQRYVDQIVLVDAVGDAEKIMAGATRFTKKPDDLLIARKATEVIVRSGYFYNGFSIQTGSGGASLAVTRFLGEYMREQNVTAGFALGGITGAMVKLHEEGLIKRLLDVQSFDLDAATSLKNNRFHQQIDADYYASPFDKGSAVNLLDAVVLSALEIDTSFNVNVLTGSDGVIRGAVGGHQDTAAGAALCIVVAPLLRGRIPTVVKQVNTVVTPGWSVDVVVTDRGTAVNPARQDIIKRLVDSHVELTTIEELQKKAESLVGIPEPLPLGNKTVGVVTYRDGSVIDVIMNIKEDI